MFVFRGALVNVLSPLVAFKTSLVLTFAHHLFIRFLISDSLGPECNERMNEQQTQSTC